MDEITKAFLDQCTQANESLDKSEMEINSEVYTAPGITKVDVETIFAAAAESTTTAAIKIGVSAVSA